MLFAFSSVMRVLLQLCVGRTFFRFPSGFHSSAALAMFPSSLLSVCPIQDRFFVPIGYGLLSSLFRLVLISYPLRPSNAENTAQAFVNTHLDLVYQRSC